VGSKAEADVQSALLTWRSKSKLQSYIEPSIMG
jgi:hypothetical protein